MDFHNQTTDLTEQELALDSHDVLDHQLTTKQLLQLIDFTDLNYEELQDTNHDDWVLYDDEERDDALYDAIRFSAWAFNSSFLANFTGLDESIFKALQDKCEDSNEAVIALIEKCGPEKFEKSNFQAFVDEAVSVDGAGHFLSTYDGNEYEIENDEGKVTHWLYKR